MLNDKYPQNCVRAEWAPLEILGLRRLKEATTSYGMHSLFVKQMLNAWSASRRIIPQDWRDLVTAILEPGPQLQWRTWNKNDAKIVGQRNTSRGTEISSLNFLEREIMLI